MSRGFPETIDTVRQRVNIVEVVSQYITLKKTGKNYQALCPFHHEKTPSFTVSEDKQIFHCFGCGAGGDVFTFLMRYENLTFYDALTELAGRVGLTIPKGGPLTTEDQKKKDLLFQINLMAAHHFHTNLLSTKAGGVARDYLARRGISHETIEQYRLGYALPGWTNLVGHLKAKSIDLKMAQSLGLVIPRKQEGWYDQFRNRIIFPIMDINGRIIGFGGRAIDDAMPKYLNSTESVIYKKSQSIYGLQVAGGEIRQRDLALIVEGYFDLLTLHQNGLRNALAPLGTALTQDQVRIMKRYTRNFVLLLDPDEAGINATFRALDPFMKEEIHPKTVSLPDGHDPDSFVQGSGAKALASMIDRAVPLMDFFIDYTAKRGNLETVEGKVKIGRTILPMVQKIRDPLERRLYVRSLSERLGVAEGDLFTVSEEGRGARQRGGQRTVVAHPEEVFPPSEEFLVEVMLNHSSLIPAVLERGVIEDFESEELRRLVCLLKDVFEEKGDVAVDEVLSQVSSESLKSRISFWALSGRFKKEDLQKTVEDCIRKIKKSRLERDRHLNLQKIKEAEKTDQTGRLKELLRERQDLIQREKNL